MNLKQQTQVQPSASTDQPAAYEAPAIVYRGKLELRAGSPLALPDFADPNNPFK